MPLDRWKPEANWTREDTLLHEYWLDRHGLIFTEVRVGGRDPLGRCPPGSKPRWIDAVRAWPPQGADPIGDIVTFGRASPGEFERAITGANVEVIEVKEGLGRFVLGQVIIGADLLEVAYQLRGVGQVVVCRIGDPLMELICERHGIKVWGPGR